MNNHSDQRDEQNQDHSESPTHELTIRRETESRSDQGNVPSQSPADSAIQARRLLFTPPIDIFGTEEGLVLRADLPGVSVERLELQIEDNKLTLFGRVKEIIPDEAKLLHQEYQVGDFYRSFILSDELDYERISAKMTHGVLEISLPRIPRARPRKIHVQAD